jgi:NAD(P)-dependent dehydrogenase (short-subunit alcohol dehydrogenase family)
MLANMDLGGKIAIVTGSGGEGSGRAEARRLAAEGCQVVVSDINEAGGKETLRLILADGGRAQFFPCDVSRRTEVQALVAFAEKTFGGLDILVNNASAPYRPGAPIEQWYETIQANLLGVIYAVEFGTMAMRRRGGGVIVNVGSTSALGHGKGHSDAPAYDIAKVGVIRLTTTLANLRETANIRVNCLVPDWVATPEVKQYYDALTPEQRLDPRIPPALTSLEEIAQAVIDLITDPSLAGRVLIFWSGGKPALIPATDPGYSALELYRPSKRGSGLARGKTA